MAAGNLNMGNFAADSDGPISSGSVSHEAELASSSTEVARVDHFDPNGKAVRKIGSKASRQVTPDEFEAALKKLRHPFSIPSTLERKRTSVTPIPDGPVSPVYQRQYQELKQEDLYFRSAFIEIDDIPIFSESDAYVENYQSIAHDHISSLLSNGSNPFMVEKLSDTLEQSTRNLILQHTKAGQTILDVGVGPGRLLGPLTQFQRFGVDISLDYLRLSKARGINVACSKIEELPYVDNLFDVVVTTDVLEHVLDLNYCTAQILRVLKPGGKLIIRVPFNDLLEAYIDTPQAYEFVHLRKFDVPSLRLHFERIFGCTYVESVPVFPYFKGTPTLRLRSLPQHSFVRDFASSIDETHPAAFLKHFLPLNHEMLLYQISQLAVDDPTAYELLAPHLFEPIEINAVFTKGAAV